MEVFLKYIQFHRFVNRGFFIGPYCPIYGFGVLFITLVIGGIFKTNGPIIVTFLLGIILCGLIEYLTSWYMEKRFHARWWDYSNKPLNINGRVWIGNLILFGLAAVIIVHFIDPFYFKIMAKLSDTTIYVVSAFLLIIGLTDFITSHFLMNIVKESIDNASGDNTEEITNEVRRMLKDKNLLVSRIASAYPEAMARPKRLVNEIKKAKAHYKEKIRELKQLEKDFKIKKEEKIHQRILKVKALKEDAFIKYNEIKSKIQKH